MLFWNRLRQSQLIKLLVKKGNYIHTHAHAFNHNQPRLATTSIPTFGAATSFQFPVRFFAAPVQVKKKEENGPKSGPKLNDKITAPIIRLVSDEGHDVVSRREALDRAKQLDLDLVEVDRNADPPVCKLMDYNKERYKQQIKVKERAKSIKANLKKGTVKEIRFTGQITSNDIQMKADAARRLLEEGYRVKCLVTRKKKEDDLGKCLSQLLSLIEDITLVDFGPIVEADQAHCVFRHVKLGASRRSGNKASKVANPSSAESTQLGKDGESKSGIEYEDGSESDTKDTQKMETLPANRYSQPTSRKPSIDSAGRPASPLGTENRYQRDPRNINAPVTSVSNNGKRVEPPPTEQLRHPQFNLASPHSREAQRSPLGTENRYQRDQRNINPPVRPVSNNGTSMEPPPTEQGRHPQFNLASPHNREAQRSGLGNPNIPRQNSPGSSYGNFDAPHSASTHELQSPPGQANRYQKVSAGDRTRSSTSHGAFDNRNSAAVNSKYSRGAIDTDGQGKFGAFSSK